MHSQDQLKAMVGQAALQYVVPGEIVGVGTGSTVNKFIDALASDEGRQIHRRGVQLTRRQHRAAAGRRHPEVFDSNAVESLSVYIDGADEIDGHGYMIKGRWRRAHARKDRGSAVQAVYLHCRCESKLVTDAGRVSRCRWR
jgi:ribose 5-phosphate isomerase A